MDIIKCEILLKALDLGSLSAAATELGYTPSGVTRMVNALEKEIGFPLIARNSKGILLTDNGRQMLPILRELAHWHELALQRSAEIRGLTVGNLNIGAYYSVAAGWLPRIIQIFQADFPGISIHMQEGGNKDLVRWLEERRVDFAIYTRHEFNGDWIPLKKDQLVAWLPDKHPWAQQAALPIESIDGAPFIKPFPNLQTDTEQLLADEGLTPDIKFTTSDNYSAYCMVAAGLGMSINNELMARDWTGNVAIRPLDPPHYITLGIALPSLQDASPAAKKFISYTKRIVE
jgi:DNA-binding transcriptional LysR family regulator